MKIQKKGIIVLLCAVLGILVMLFYRAWLGIPIYLIGAAIAVIHFRKDSEANAENIITHIIGSLKEGDIGAKLMAVVLILLPVFLIVGSIFWSVVDTSRQVDAMFAAISFGNFLNK